MARERIYRRIVDGRIKYPSAMPDAVRLFDVRCTKLFFLRVQAKSLIGGLLTADPAERLTFRQLREHEFFADVDFERLLAKDVIFAFDVAVWFWRSPCSYRFRVAPLGQRSVATNLVRSARCEALQRAARRSDAFSQNPSGTQRKRSFCRFLKRPCVPINECVVFFFGLRNAKKKSGPLH